MFETIVSIKEVVKKTGLSRTTIWRKRRDKSFPNPVQISDGRIGFKVSDLDAWSAGLGAAV